MRLSGLDALRGIAVLLVLLRHSWPQIFHGSGIIGVIIFFVLSGYLITGVLRRDITKFGRIRYTRFYCHRAFRLIPALLGFLFVYAVTEYLFNIFSDRSDGRIVPTIFAAIFYIQDLPHPFHVSSAISHLWTLAVEEQFYFVWPFFLLFALRRRIVNRLFAVSAFLILGIMVLSVFAIYVFDFSKMPNLYTLPTTWGIALVVGGGLQVYQTSLAALISRPYVRYGLGAVSTLFLVYLSLYAEVKESVVFYIVGGPLVTFLSCILVLIAATHTKAMPRWTFPLRALGFISYAAYLWNYPIVYWVNAVLIRETFAANFIAFVLTILVAIISWHSVERLGRKWRRNYDSRFGSAPDRTELNTVS